MTKSKINTTLLEYNINKHNKIAKWMAEKGYINEAEYHLNKKEEFKDCLNVVTEKTEGYLQRPKTTINIMKTITILAILFTSTIWSQEDYIRFNFITKESGKVIGIAKDESHLKKIVTEYKENNNGKKFAMHEQGVQKQWSKGYEDWDINEAYFRSLSEGGKIYQVISHTTLRSLQMVKEFGIDEAAKMHQERMEEFQGKKMHYNTAFVQLYNTWQLIEEYDVDNNGKYQTSLEYNTIAENGWQD